MNNRKTYSEAIMASPWKVIICGDKKCWCRVIETTKKVTYSYEVLSETRTETDKAIVVSSGSIPADIAKYIVKLHNNNLKNK